jgi:hypothetical protein
VLTAALFQPNAEVAGHVVWRHLERAEGFAQVLRGKISVCNRLLWRLSRCCFEASEEAKERQRDREEAREDPGMRASDGVLLVTSKENINMIIIIIIIIISSLSSSSSSYTLLYAPDGVLLVARQQTADSRQQTAASRQQTADS